MGEDIGLTGFSQEHQCKDTRFRKTPRGSGSFLPCTPYPGYYMFGDVRGETGVGRVLRGPRQSSPLLWHDSC